MLKKWLNEARAGRPVWLDDVRENCEKSGVCIPCILRLTAADGSVHDRPIAVPVFENEAERSFVLEYLAAFVFNILSCFGGRELRFFLPEGEDSLRELVSSLREVFQLESNQRSGYGKVISISERLSRAFSGEEFRFVLDDMSRYAPHREDTSTHVVNLGEKLRNLTKRAEKAFCCGLDIGGTDIKAAVSLDGELLFVKVFDWDPASETSADALLKPILLLTRLLRLSAVCPQEPIFLAAMGPEADLEQMRLAVETLEKSYADKLRGFDSIGVSFPDVVIRDRILGGETPKTQGIRQNGSTDYDRELARLSELNEELEKLCRAHAQVHTANDGGIAAFTAAVEMACRGERIEDGVFAHSIGTDLGTGYYTVAGKLPDLPLEMYDYLIDLGSYPQRSFPPDDVRSVRNENSGLPDARKYLGQSAAFRLASEKKPEILRPYLADDGAGLRVRREPDDMRKPCLEHLMHLASQGQPEAMEIFRQIGRHLGWISREIRFVLQPETNKRFLYGRFIKHPACFSLLQEGCREVMAELELVAANEELACSPLMRQLARLNHSSVAQFGQAIGAIYFGLSGN